MSIVFPEHLEFATSDRRSHSTDDCHFHHFVRCLPLIKIIHIISSPVNCCMPLTKTYEYRIDGRRIDPEENTAHKECAKDCNHHRRHYVVEIRVAFRPVNVQQSTS